MNDLNQFKGSIIPTLKFVQSSNIVGVSYEKETKTLYVMFGNKKVYMYLDVEEYDYDFLIKTSSAGSYLASHIKPKYPASFVFATKDYLVSDYKDCKLVITDLDEGRGHVLIDGVKHTLFDPSPTIEKCYICGATEETSEITKCDNCGEYVCADSKECSEHFSDSGTTECRKCLDKQTKYYCDTCYTKKYEDCPFGGSVQWCYSCPEYVELTEELKIKEHLKEIIALELDVHFDAISDDYNLKDELGADSLDFVEIIIEIENAYPCLEIADSVANELEIKTVGEIIEFITKKIIGSQS